MEAVNEKKIVTDLEHRTYNPVNQWPWVNVFEEISHQQGQVYDIENPNGKLEGLVLQSEETRNMSALDIIAAGWIICNSWAGIAATFALAIAQGGPVTLIYGPIIMFVVVGCCAVTLAELASVYPTAGGQYHWVSILAPEKWSRGLVSVLSHKSRGRGSEMLIHISELLLRRDKRLLLDCHWRRGSHHRPPAGSGDGCLLEPNLHTASMACISALSGL